jgi:hypothetical protein
MLEGLLRVDDLELDLLGCAPLLKGESTLVSLEMGLQVVLGDGDHVGR